ncbi:MAG: cytochrome c oxidase accessory protein CcoG [Verrucomicrobiae bacterium]|nr:cytochrome c oxidase accessory protein CcoG [Verrucomicrobiae bacterium]
MRQFVGVLLLGVYVGLPWIVINGYPAVFFDLPSRRFHLFGLTFLAQDVWLAFFVVTGVGFTLFYVTALFGRLWCGWACPYTVFLEHVFRPIERLVDGDATARRKGDKAPMTGGKIVRRIIKHTLYLLLASLIAHIFLSYFVSLPKLYQIMGQSPLENKLAFAIMLFLTGALYFAFSWFREQFCIILCPYGRIQSALTDDDTMVIGYDSGRGEPRGKASDPSNGACVNCMRCVNVCPTGIDIRNGLQMECIGCAACIDACDEIMEKVKRPTGLIRYDSMNGLAGRKTRFVRPRTILYSVFMALGAFAMIFGVTRVHDVEASLTRLRGNPYFVTEDAVRNQFQIRLITKRNVPTTFRLSLEGAPAGAHADGMNEAIVVPAQGSIVHPFVVSIDRDQYEGKSEFNLVVQSEPGGTELKRKISFLGPDAKLLREDQDADKQNQSAP